MTDYRDPRDYMSDPYRNDPYRDRMYDRENSTTAGGWGWLLGIVLVVGLVAWALSMRTDSTQVAQNPDQPAASRPAPTPPVPPTPGPTTPAPKQ